MNFVHVASYHYVRETAGGRKGGNILFRRVSGAINANRQISFEKKFSRLCRNLNKFVGGKLVECGFSIGKAENVPAYDARINLAKSGLLGTISIIIHGGLTKANVRLAEPQAWNVRCAHVSILLRQLFSAWPQKGEPRRLHPMALSPKVLVE